MGYFTSAGTGQWLDGTLVGADVRQLGIYWPISRGKPAILHLVSGIKLKDIWSVVGPKNICFLFTPWKYQEGSAVTNSLFNFFFINQIIS